MLIVGTNALHGARMPKTAVIQARIDPGIKERAQKIFDALHISMSEAITIYLTQVALQKGIPFEIRIPNEVTLAALQDVEKRTQLRSAKSVKKLFEEMAR
jgi:DNA-damage-inducible protein J